MQADRDGFTTFVGEVEPRLRRALVALRGPDLGRDATAEALAWAWANWDAVTEMKNPVGYLYRVGSSRSRLRPVRGVPAPDPAAAGGFGFEPGLDPALARLTDRQRAAVVLVHGCGWTHQEVADALRVSRSSVGTHVERALARLREELGVDD
ncbi:MAG TPA: sigma factor-like helix-turn-helix DNA-binding protein [Iamia sp.]|nr:sigma factor-like helix-turn-helix DNA-binding protein [Iamia sp.]